MLSRALLESHGEFLLSRTAPSPPEDLTFVFRKGTSVTLSTESLKAE